MIGFIYDFLSTDVNNFVYLTTVSEKNTKIIYSQIDKEKTNNQIGK